MELLDKSFNEKRTKKKKKQAKIQYFKWNLFYRVLVLPKMANEQITSTDFSILEKIGRCSFQYSLIYGASLIARLSIKANAKCIVVGLHFIMLWPI